MIGALVRGAVSTYLSSTDDVTYADTLLDAVSRPEHRDAVNELAERVTGEAVRVLVSVSAAEVANARHRRRGGQSRHHAGGTGAASPDAGGAPASTPAAGASRPGGWQAAGAPFGEGPSGTPPVGAMGGRPHRRAMSVPLTPGGGVPMEHNRALLGADLSGGPGDESSQHNGGSSSPQERVSPGSSGGSSTRSGASLRDGGDVAQAGWVSTARVALNLASAPEARALIRDVAGAAAGAAVKSLVYAVPGAIYSSLPSLPFRRRSAAVPPQAPAAAPAAAAPAPAASHVMATQWERTPAPGGAPAWRQPPSTEVMVHHQPGRSSKRMPRIGSYGDSGDEDDVWHDASPVPIIPQDWAVATSSPPSGPSSPTDGSAAGSSGSGAAFWRGMDSARVSQGALAAALLVHSVALAPGAAARLGML